MKTHFVRITFLSFDLGTSSHVSFFSIWLSSSSISLIQCSSFLAYSKLVGSTVDSKYKCTCSGVRTYLLILVSILALLSPIICSGGWFFWTQGLGVLKGVWKFCWLFPLSSSSCFSSCYSSYSSSSLSCFSSISIWSSWIYGFLLSFLVLSQLLTLMLSTILLSMRL